MQTELVKTDENIESVMPDMKEALNELEYIETHLDEYKNNNKWEDLRKKLIKLTNESLFSDFFSKTFY